jgi:hypothetical protein
MRTTLTTFQRGFAKARAAADRGETVTIQAAGAEYLFQRRPKTGNPFADLITLAGSINLPRRQGSPRERIRDRLRRQDRVD